MERVAILCRGNIITAPDLAFLHCTGSGEQEPTDGQRATCLVRSPAWRCT